jgi:hypothetical protein
MKLIKFKSNGELNDIYRSDICEELPRGVYTPTFFIRNDPTTPLERWHICCLLQLGSSEKAIRD